ATVAISGTGVSATGVTVVSSTKLTATFVIASTAAGGARNVTVSTSAGTSAAQSFTVNLPAPVKPTLTSLAPSAASRGARITVTLAGTNFTSPATVTVQGSGVTVSNVVVVSSSKITATFRVSQSAARRAHDTSVTTGAGTSNTLSFAVQ